MKRKRSGALKGIPFIYALLIILFLVLHLLCFEENTFVLGNALFRERRTKGSLLAPSRISKLQITSNGLCLNFADQDFQIITEDGISRSPRLNSLQSGDNQGELFFNYGLTLKFKSLPQNTSMDIKIPQTLPPIKELRIKAEVLQNFQQMEGEKGEISFSDGISTFFLTSDAPVQLERGKLIISMKDRTRGKLSLNANAPGLGRPIAEWLAQKEQDQPLLKEKILENFTRKVYAGWKNRFEPGPGTWKQPDKDSNFNEKTMVLFLSEAYRQGEKASLKARILDAGYKHSNSLSWYSSPFSGDIIRKTAPFLSTRPENLLAQKKALAFQSAPETTPCQELLELKKKVAQARTSAKDLTPWIKKNIYPLLAWLDDGVYILPPEENSTNSLVCLEAAELMEEAGEISKNENLLKISAILRNSILKKADAEGILPRRILFSKDQPFQKEGSLLPFEVFALYEKRNYSPRISLFPELGADGWLYSASRSVSLNKTRDELAVHFKFPAGRIEHAAIKGVEPFDRIILHGIRWKSDPAFQRYSDGWSYDKTNKVLYLKIKHRNFLEKVRIIFTPPTPPPAEIPPEPSVEAPEEGKKEA